MSYSIIAKSRFRVDKVGHILQSPNASDVICTNTEEGNGNCRENWAKFERVVATKVQADTRKQHLAQKVNFELYDTYR